MAIFDLKKIPETLHWKLKKILGITSDAEYQDYIDSLASEASVYIKMKLDDDVVLNNDQEELLKTLYVHYTMFSKTENEQISLDKLDTLNLVIEDLNKKNDKKKITEEKKSIRRITVW